MEKTYLIGDVEKITGIPKRKIKYMVEAEIITPFQKKKEGKKEWIYSEKNIAEIQQVELFRELGYLMEDIGLWVNDEDFDWNSVLPKQIDLLIKKKRHIENLIFTAEIIRYITNTESEKLWIDISSFDNNIHHFAQDTFGREQNDSLVEREAEQFGKKFMVEMKDVDIEKEMKMSIEMTVLLKKVLNKGPNSKEVQQVLKNIFKYYGMPSNDATFTSDDVMFFYRILRTFSLDRMIDMIFEDSDATKKLEDALSYYFESNEKEKN